MIGKGKAIAHGGNAIDYALRDGKLDKIVGRNMIESDAPADILREFEMVNQHNYRCKNKYIRYEIGISPKDIGKLKPGDMIKIARTFANKMGLQNHQWIACTHKDTGKPHIHLIANRIGIDSKVFDTTFVSNRSAKIAEEISREMGLTIAKDVQKQKEHQEAHTDPARQQTKEKLQQIAYYELFKNTSLEGFLYGLEKEGVGIEPANNKQGKTYGIRFTYEGQTFKASEIGREFGFRSLAGNFSSSLEENRPQRLQQNYNQDESNQQSYSGVSSSIASLLADLFTPNGHNPEEENTLKHKKKKPKKRYYGRQQ
ncbi:mobilization protein [Bacteroides sp. 214]|uniref:relaxase/mobilization nuclease domain-containing protein n=1 Tax=Bacteroides sp. 214 TaxID=2302935 RepID=UPI0013D5F4F8|nr:relaxase/mobilization nuclease domain-containing protein [Bacteroides sp. 214]NDW12677.1 mobilization protein [Bacteroides sp. 214]